MTTEINLEVTERGEDSHSRQANATIYLSSRVKI